MCLKYSNYGLKLRFSEKATKFDKISISINPEGCPPLAATSLGQAVCYDLQSQHDLYTRTFAGRIVHQLREDPFFVQMSPTWS